MTRSTRSISTCINVWVSCRVAFKASNPHTGHIRSSLDIKKMAENAIGPSVTSCYHTTGIQLSTYWQYTVMLSPGRQSSISNWWATAAIHHFGPTTRRWTQFPLLSYICGASQSNRNASRPKYLSPTHKSFTCKGSVVCWSRNLINP